MKKAFWTYIFGLILFGSNGVAASCIHLTSQQIVLLRTLLGFALLAVLYFATIGALPAHTVAICGYLEPISAVVFSRVILREVISPVQMVGILLILGGAIVGDRASGAEGC